MRLTALKVTMLGLHLAILLTISSSILVDANNLRSTDADLPSAVPSSSTSSISVLKKFLTWPFPDESDENGIASYPIWSTHKKHGSADGKNVLNPFTVSGAALERYERRQANCRLESGESIFDIDKALAAADGKAFNEGLVQDQFSDAHDENHDDTHKADAGDVHADSHKEAHGDILASNQSHGEAHGDSHDAHSDAHDMVVHVTYEDICEYYHV